MRFAFGSVFRTAFAALALSVGAAKADGLTLNITDTGYDPVPAGAAIVYAVRIENGDNTRQPADTVTFAIPANTIYTGVAGGLQNCAPAPELPGPGVVTCEVPSLAPREAISGQIMVEPQAAGTISFAGNIVNAGVNVIQTTTVTQGADLGLELSGPATVQAGAFTTLTATITNHGPYPSNGGSFSMMLPSGFSSDVALPSGCSISGALISCTLPGPIAVGAAVTLDFTTQVVTDNQSNIAVSASIHATTPPDPDLTNDSSSTSINILPGTDVSLGKSRAPSGLVFTGQEVTFTLSPRYAGNAPLEATITDTVPANYAVTGVSPAGSGWTCSATGNEVGCSYASATADPANYRAPITITATAITETAPGAPVVNFAAIASSTDVAPGNNQASDGGADIAAPEFDLVAHKSGPRHGLVTVGNQYDWQIWTDNQGNVPFQGRLFFTEHLPAGLRADEIIAPAGWTCDPLPVTGPRDILCRTDNYQTTGLGVGARTPSLTVRATVLAEGAISNGLTVGYEDQNNDDRELANNTTTSGVHSGEVEIANLSLRKSVISAGPYVSGDPVRFRIEVVNAGPATAQNVVIADRLQDLYFADSVTTAATLDSVPTGMSCNVTRGSGFYSDLRCDLNSLPICTAGVDCPVLELTVLAGDDGTKTNTAETYSTTTPDPDYANNSASAGYSVDPRTDVTVEKTASHPHMSELSAGQQLIYTIAAIVPANGLSDAEGVRIVDSLPAGLRIVSATPSQGSCSPATGLSDGLTTAGSTLTCDLGTIQNGSRHSVTVTAVPSTSVMNSTVTNNVAISTTTTEIDGSNNADSISHQIRPPELDLIINKSDSKDPLELNDSTVYTVTVANAGPSEAFAVVITDTLPVGGMRLDAIAPLTPGLTCAPAGGAAVGSIGGQILCRIDHLGVGATASFNVEMTGTVRGRWTNSVNVTSAEAAFDPQANNSVTETTSVYERVDLSVSKGPSKPDVDLLEGFDWIITVANRNGTGIGLAEGVELRDTLPANMVLTGPPTGTAGASCDGPVGGRNVICILPDMAAGESVTVTVPVRATAVTSDPQPFTNSAMVSTLSFDADPSNNAGSGSVNVLTTEVSGTIWRDFNENSVRDLSQDAGVSGVTVTLTGTDSLGATVTRTTTTNSTGGYSFTLLPPGVDYRVSYSTAPSGYLVGRALPTGAGGGMASGNQAITAITATTAVPAVTKDFTLIPQPQIALAKQVGTPALRADGSYSLTYTLRLRNNSQEPLGSVQLHDTLQAMFGVAVGASPAPGQYQIASANQTGGSGLALNAGFNGMGDTLLVSGGTIPAATTATVQVVVIVNPPLPRPAATMALVNTATSSATGQWSGKALSDASNNGATPVAGSQSPTTATLTFAPALALTKTAVTSALSSPPQPGDVITYDFVVRNTGNTPLLNVTVTDPLPDLVWVSNTPIAELAHGASSPAGQFRATYTLKESDIENGQVANTATATGKWGVGDGDTVSRAATATVQALAQPGLEVVKAEVSNTVRNPTVVGDSIRYSFTVTNTGNVALRNLTLTDALTGIAPDPAGSFTIGTLPPVGQTGNSVTLYADYPVTQNDIDAGRVLNTASVNGVYGTGNRPIATNSNAVETTLHQNPLMRVTKVVNSAPTAPQAGNMVTWTVTIENIGNTGLTIGTIAEPLPNTTVSAPAAAVLAPGESTTATATHTLSQAEIDAGQVENQVTVSGTVPGSGTPFTPTPSGNDPATPNTDPTVTPLPAHPEIALLKELTSDVSAPLMPDDEIEFRFTIRNTGNVTLNNIVLTDDLAGVTLDNGALGALNLAPGASTVVTGTYRLLASDIQAGGLQNTATVTASDPHATSVSDKSGTAFENDLPTPVSLLRRPEIDLVKTVANAPAAPVKEGDSVTYAFTIRNTGNVELRNIVLTELVSGVTVDGSRTAPLPVGEADTTSFTATHILTQADIDAGIFTNRAEINAVGAAGATGVDQPVSHQAEVDLSINPAPALTILKEADETQVNDPAEVGDTITYSFAVTNTGNVTLTNVTVTDPLPDLTFTNGVNSIASLAPGVTGTVTATYAVKQADIDAGKVDNRASAVGTTPGNLTTVPVVSEEVSVPLEQAPAIALVKRITSTLPNPTQAGAEVTYGFTVTNTGNVTLSNVTVTDPLFDPAVVGGPITLLPGESRDTFTASYTLTQADIERGYLDNRAEASGVGGGGTVTAQSRTEAGVDEPTRLTIPQLPGIELEKTGNISGFADPSKPVPGDEVRYSFTVTNTGNVILKNIALTDLGLSFDTPPPAPFDLDPGESRALSNVGGYAIEQGDINRGSYENTATATGGWGDDPVSNTVSDDDTVDTPLEPAPGIALVKVIDTANSVLSTPPKAGDVLHYDFTVTNTGNVTLTDITLVDPLTGIDLTGSLGRLEPGQSDATAFSATYTLTQDDVNLGSVTNQATATGTWGTDPAGDPLTVSDLSGASTGDNDETVHRIDREPALSVVKSAETALQSPPRVGDLITYSFAVRNTGNVTLTDIQLQDPLPGLDFGSTGNEIPELQPGVEVTLTATHELRQEEIEAGAVENTASVTGTFTDPATGDEGGVGATSNTITIPLDQEPGLSVVKAAASAISDPAVVGQVITYTFTVRNTGNVALTGVTLADPLPGLQPSSFTLGDMQPGDVETRTATYAIVQADIDAGEVRNQAVATGTFETTPHEFPSGPTVDGPPGDTVVPVPQDPAMELVKIADASRVTDPAGVGQEILYSFTVTNTGNVTLRNLEVSDPLPGLAPASFPVADLAPGQAATVGSARYAITLADINAGRVENRALATGEYGPAGSPRSLTANSATDAGLDGPTVTSLSGVPRIALTKQFDGIDDVNGNGVDDAGDIVRWSFRVENTGNVTLTDIDVNERLDGVVLDSGPIASLDPGGQATVTGAYVLAQGDIDRGRLDNVATASGTPPGGGDPVDSAESSTSTTLDQSGALTLVKSAEPIVDANGNGRVDIGDTIAYTITVTNSGNVTIRSIAVDDAKLGVAGAPLSPAELQPGASGTAGPFTYVLTQADINAGEIVNQAFAAGVSPDGSTVTDDGELTTAIQRQPGLSLVKSVAEIVDANDSGITDAGDVIRWSFRVENTGNVTLTDVTVDEQLPDVTLTGGPIPELAPGAVDEATFGAVYTIKAEDAPGLIVNTATASGAAAGSTDRIVSEASTTSTPTVAPQSAVTLVKSVVAVEDVNGNGVNDAGDIIRWSFRIENTGNVPLTNVTVDEQLDGVELSGGPISRLNPGEVDTSTFSASYVIAEPDADAGVINRATARGTPPLLAGQPQQAVVSSVAMTETPVVVPRRNIVVTKQAGVRLVRRGDVVPYSITIENRDRARATVDLVDKLPPGFAYVPGAAEIDGVKVEPVVSGRDVRFTNVSVAAGATVTIVLQARVGASVQPGDHVNTATAVTPGTNAALGPPGRATVRLRIEHVFDCGEIIGKVFDDRNRNGYQDEAEGERGLPGVRLATVRGLLITTDRHGRFSVPCADIPEDQIGSNFILKLDTRTLPTGYRLTTENPRVVRLTKGKLTKLNFGAAIDKVVRIDLTDAAFDTGSSEPGRELRQGLAKLVPMLAKEHSVVRLTYYAHGGQESRAKARLKAAVAELRRAWKAGGGPYQLGIETKIVRK